MNFNKFIIKKTIQLESKSWMIVCAVIFKIILGWSYSDFVAPVFSYSGLLYEFNVIKYFESWIIFFVFMYLSSSRLDRPSDYLINFLNFSFLVPLLVYYSYANAERLHLYFVIISISLMHIFRGGRLFKFSFFENGEALATLILFSGILIVTVWMVYSGGLGFFNLDFAKVYDFRSGASDALNIGVMGYLNIWATKVFGPVLLAITLWRKKYVIAVQIFLLHIFWFGVSSHKSVLFYPFLVTFLWVWFRYSKALALVPLAMSIVVIISMYFYFCWDDVIWGSLFVRRIFFIPAQLTFTYYEFFSSNQFVFWSNSFLSGFFDYPYDRNTALLIGDYMGGESSANNSFLSTGYMHAGIFGVIIYGVLVGLLFKIIDSIARDGIPAWVAVSCLIVPSQALITSADLPTALLTHGIGISLIILFLIRASPNKNY
jgi:hypothetical protein